MNRCEALVELDRRVAAIPRSRIGRLFVDLRKMIWTRGLKALKISRPIDAKTFWGGCYSGILPEATSAVVYRWGFLDEPVARTLLTKLDEGMVFVDVGAHFGFFSLLASWLVGPTGRVVSVEAMPSTFSQLQANVTRNSQHDNITLQRAAAHSEATVLKFNDFGLVLSSLNSAFNARGQAAGSNAAARSVDVEAIRMDDLLGAQGLTRVDLIKIDAESSELFVLEGLTETIRTFRPEMVVEMSDNTDAEATHSLNILTWMDHHGYQPRKWVNGALLEYRLGDRINYDNFVFIPVAL